VSFPHIGSAVNPGHVLNFVAGKAFSDSLTMISFSSKASSCNQCLSPLMLCVQISLMARCTRCNFMW